MNQFTKIFTIVLEQYQNAISYFQNEFEKLNEIDNLFADFDKLLNPDEFYSCFMYKIKENFDKLKNSLRTIKQSFFIIFIFFIK